MGRSSSRKRISPPLVLLSVRGKLCLVFSPAGGRTDVRGGSRQYPMAGGGVRETELVGRGDV